ncbi:E3 ubiquitin-protein ligase RING1-like [Hondaea fermentalgiana]|uniref:E3 ubiquitin-protein ligase RING1-like n=1 Tax=Hondaea fermentalgiana TaxID=2315210 RepID=A0A2R5G5U0_9STRA|nr:E3 ubiquitin-protein ligase RING1-like [Hondaea fermentalgiana]|eukprot:GBG25905.1 E3 ubiquitin-protein ligase RING1-like [Hondaea fermentalgiana]
MAQPTAPASPERIIEVVDQPRTLLALLRYDHHRGLALLFVMVATWTCYMASVVPMCINVLTANPVPRLADARNENCSFDALFTLHWYLLLLTTVTQLLHVAFTLPFAFCAFYYLVQSIDTFMLRYAHVQNHPLWIFNWNLNRLQYSVPCLGFAAYWTLGETFSHNACGFDMNRENPASLWAVILLPVFTKYIVTHSIFLFMNTVRFPDAATPNMLRNLETRPFRDCPLFDAEGFECAICLMPLQDADEVISLDCGRSHVFHRNCLYSWLCLQNSCPLCRAQPIAGRPHLP